MKKLTLLLLAFATVFTLSQCKKNVEQITPVSPSGNIVSITLDVSGGGSKVIVDPETGEVSFQQNDVVYVASGGHYVGKLTCRGTKFMGDLLDPTQGQPLYFYFFGNYKSNEEKNGELEMGTSTSCTVEIGDQTNPNNMPVISYAVSQENFAGSGTYHAFFENRAALVLFNVTSSSAANTCIKGLKNKVVVDFSNNETPYAYGMEGEGVITLPGGSGERWAILLPQLAMGPGADGSVYSEDLHYSGTRGAIPRILENGYLFEGVDVDVTSMIPPTGAIKGLFTVNDLGKQVYFSKGNLQYKASTDTWRFAGRQYDIIGSDNEYISEDYDGYIDLFGYGTSGYGGYNPWMAATDESYYFDDDIYGTNYDWGVYNAISNGGNQAGLWRTLSEDEWIYLVLDRTTPSGILFAKAQVDGMNGVILLPDDWDASFYPLDYVNSEDVYYNENIISESDWADMEAHGAVFLPAAGLRIGDVTLEIDVEGHYWSSEEWGNSVSTLSFSFSYLQVDFDYPDKGLSVRLVQDVN